ncbi:hypothetical protein J5H40_20535, partial [Stenotrophomonas maltophilia]|nr:hypothetical protein [Stenotrophomonas maltophilia]
VFDRPSRPEWGCARAQKKPASTDAGFLVSGRVLLSIYPGRSPASAAHDYSRADYCGCCY